MAAVANTFEGGSNGTTITTGNSGAGSGTAFNFVSIVAGGAATYTSTNPYRGALSGSFGSGATVGTSYAEWSTAVGAASSGTVHTRVRFRLPTLPADATGVRVAVVTDGAGAFVGDVRVINTGKIQLRNNAGTVLGTSNITLVADQFADVGLAVTVFSATVGVLEMVIYDGFGVVSQTVTSAASQNTLQGGGTNKVQFGMVRSIANQTVVIDDCNATTAGAYPSVTVAPTVWYGPWTGGVTDTTFGAGYVVQGVATSCRLAVSTAVGLTSPVYSATGVPDADGMVKLSMTGLTANTQYYFGVEADGILRTAGRGEVKTFPASGSQASFSVAFGSCMFDVPSDTTFPAILARTGATGGRALQIIHMGDMNYKDWDGTATAATVFAQHMVDMGAATMAPCLAKIPLNYIWDNHDWGGDFSDRTAAAGNVVAASWRRVYPSYTLPATDGRGGYHTWVIGRIRFIQLDVRSYRDPQANVENASKTMLGTEQKAWFKAQLSASEPVKIICGNYPWQDDGDGSGRWGSYSDEFTELSDYIDANCRGRVYCIFGDRHFLAADDGTYVSNRGIPQSGGAPFQQASVAVTGTWSAGSYTNSPTTVQAYGWLDVTDAGSTITIAYTGKTSNDGTTRVSMTTTFTVGGTPGTLTYELNRLAGKLVGGTPSLAKTAAANVWAGTSGLTLVDALNEKAGSSIPARDVAGALNVLAGTAGLTAADAAARIVS